MRGQMALSLLMIVLVGFGCRPRDGALQNTNRSPYDNPVKDATRGEKPVKCVHGACGAWRAPDLQTGQNVVKFQMSLSLNQFTQKVTCHYRDGSIKTAQVTVRAAVSANQIDIYQNESARDRGPAGQPDCESRVDQTRVRYDNPNRNTLRILLNNGDSKSWEKEIAKP